jgi:hypothetical protein
VLMATTTQRPKPRASAISSQAAEASAQRVARTYGQTLRLWCEVRAPQPHQIQRGTAGNHGESSPARRGRTRTVRPGQRPTQPQMPAASQAEDLASVGAESSRVASADALACGTTRQRG